MTEPCLNCGSADCLHAECMAGDFDVVMLPDGRVSINGQGHLPTVRPRRGDLEEATSPHPFRPSGEYVGYGETKERCDLCGLVQRGAGTMHP